MHNAATSTLILTAQDVLLSMQQFNQTITWTETAPQDSFFSCKAVIYSLEEAWWTDSWK